MLLEHSDLSTIVLLVPIPIKSKFTLEKQNFHEIGFEIERFQEIRQILLQKTIHLPVFLISAFDLVDDEAIEKFCENQTLENRTEIEYLSAMEKKHCYLYTQGWFQNKIIYPDTERLPSKVIDMLIQCTYLAAST